MRISSLLLLVTACTAEPALDTTEQGVTTVTTIRVSGKFADVLIHDGDTNGQVTASRDDIAMTKSLDFGYAAPDPMNPDLIIFINGSGTIPNNSFTVSATNAQLNVTTSFPVTRCVFNQITGEQTCATTTPITFNLTWVRDGFGSLKETTQRKEVLGPTSTKFNGTFKSFTALVNGTWTGHTAVDNGGNLRDTENTTVTREVTMAP